MKLSHVVTALLMLSSTLAAQNVTMKGTLSHTLKIPSSHPYGTYKSPVAAPTSTREIKLLKITLSNQAKAVLANKAKQTLLHIQKQSVDTQSIAPKLPSHVQLTMNGVPVLDQGNHGSCVMFAATAAIDAVLYQSDYISQLCLLQVGNYIAENTYGESGWDGSYAPATLNRIAMLGIVNKEQEASSGCGNFYAYPLEGTDPLSTMKFEDYHQISEALDDDQLAWSSILDAETAVHDRVDTNKNLTDLKVSLKKGDRVMFGVLLLDFDLGVMGAVGNKNVPNDTWVLTAEIARDLYLQPNFGGHEMVITGYDDNATATDDSGFHHKGLLTLRNSWGNQLGDKGNFYMSYDYFKVLALEAYRIRKIDPIEN